jgi:hypothetical protein
MQYLLLICGDEDVAVGDAEDAVKWVETMNARGVRKFGAALRETSTATMVRSRDGEVLLSDGPFAETKEHILGFDLLECADLDEALEVAAAHPVARWGGVEVRPLQDGLFRSAWDGS